MSRGMLVDFEKSDDSVGHIHHAHPLTYNAPSVNRKSSSPIEIECDDNRAMRKSSEPSHPDPGLHLPDQAGAGPGLEFPDAPDFISRRTRLTLAELLPLLEENRKSLSSVTLRAYRRRPVSAEFIL
jgi:hypothetical protein